MNDAPWAAWIVDAALVVAVLEAVALVAYNASTGRGPAWRGLIANLAAGLCLMAGVRVAVAGAPWPWIAACLAGAGIAHVLDLRRRTGAPAAR